MQYKIPLLHSATDISFTDVNTRSTYGIQIYIYLSIWKWGNISFFFFNFYSDTTERVTFTEPQFVMERSQSSHIVLVLDASGSMEYRVCKLWVYCSIWVRSNLQLQTTPVVLVPYFAKKFGLLHSMILKYFLNCMKALSKNVWCFTTSL